MKKDNTLILMVDDSPLVSARLAGLLKEANVNALILWAANYSEAMEVMLLRKPQIVVTDINLPGKSGLDLLRTIRATDKEVAIVMLTNQVNEYYKAMCRVLGANYFLDKSNEFDQLPGLLHSIASRQRPA